jgi:hypothetical protein
MQTKPIPIALPSDLLEEIDKAHKLTGLSKADIMRLAMRIGLVDLRAAEHDLPRIVKKIADDKGVSFQAFADAKQEQATDPALNTAEQTQRRTPVTYEAPPRRGLKPPPRPELNEKA